MATRRAQGTSSVSQALDDISLKLRELRQSATASSSTIVERHDGLVTVRIESKDVKPKK